ncbi:winged helix DNA-binding domain-containing protein [Amycolatopsis sp. H20-H5]|uniref:winged helix DNA-binding domain-containing protein n=1 Tax=Amycolatopsis sp. H20-H5 TaxID=3046309 RepID=UPI002DB8F245|nr:winged helix DNA-binding domain-containing protein [Amycolatopsis sp. H20-H5]MEC3977602.1 winged helix DNA-binding domain-containing protein [Amycolatopsis sp. H20-H5]
MPAPLLSLRALNRATLDRQLLLRRANLTALEAIKHLAGLQAQAPFPPYYALHARLDGFRQDDLARLLLGREVVRIVLMRGTVHLVTAADALAWRPLVQVLMDRDLATNAQHSREIAGLDHTEVAQAARDLLAGRPHTGAGLGEELGRRWPDRAANSLTHVARGLLPLVQIPPRGVWGRSGQATYVTAEDWLDAPLDPRPSPGNLMRRYLAAFGPATVRDAQAWSGLTRLGEVAERLRPELRTFRDESGRELFDLPGAPRPGADTPAPPRLLGPFDQTLLSYADRTRVISDDHRKRVITQNGLVKGTVLLDGYVRGSWESQVRRKVATLRVTPFERFTKRDMASVESAGRRLLRWAEADAEVREVRFLP